MTDETTHLRALLAEQTARAELFARLHQEELGWRKRTEIERDQALAANAELRAALEHWTHIYSKALSPPGHDTYGEGMRDAKNEVAAILKGTK